MVSFTPRPLYPREKFSGTHWIGGLVDPRICMNDVEKILPYQDSNSDPSVVQHVATRYTDYAILSLQEKNPLPLLFIVFHNTSFETHKYIVKAKFRIYFTSILKNVVYTTANTIGSITVTSGNTRKLHFKLPVTL
jgi:hypothetical protein